jgi:hypothetical protein
MTNELVLYGKYTSIQNIPLDDMTKDDEKTRRRETAHGDIAYILLGVDSLMIP